MDVFKLSLTSSNCLNALSPCEFCHTGKFKLELNRLKSFFFFFFTRSAPCASLLKFNFVFGDGADGSSLWSPLQFRASLQAQTM